MSSRSAAVPFLCLVIIFFLVGAAPSAVAEDDEDDDDRDVSFVPEEDGFHVVSYSVGYNTNDRFELDFNEGSIELWYEENADIAESPSWQLELSLKELVSFQDNGNGYYDAGDTVVSSMELDDDMYVSAQPIQETLADGGVKTTLACTYEGGFLTLVFIITDSTVDSDGILLRPTEVKLDIRITGFGDEEDVGDYVGLFMSVETDSESAVLYENDSELNLTNDGLGGYFRWAETALIDGVSRPVGSTWDEQTLTLSYPYGETIVHDPVIGVNSVASSSGTVDVGVSGDPLLYGVGVAIAAGAVAGAVILTVRKKH